MAEKLPIVRCEDCYYFVPDKGPDADQGTCTDKYGPCNGQMVSPRWFCANGESE